MHRSIAITLLLLPLTTGNDAAVAGSPRLVDTGDEQPVDFVHFNGMTGQLYFPEMTGGGVAAFDFDGDGDLDLYFPQGHLMGDGGAKEDPVFPSHYPEPTTDRLYRADGRPAGETNTLPRFVDVTPRAGLASTTGYGMGVAAADFDDDGWVDLYVTDFGSNHLLRNRGDGTFEDRTASSGADDPRWTVTATPFDFDGDGLLDLYLGNYVDFSYDLHKICRTPSGARDYCGPLAYEPEPDRLLKNAGGFRFTDVSASSGVGLKPGSTLGSIAFDADEDGLLDLFVANDGMENYLWRNEGDGAFEEIGLLSGVALNADGQPEASMGIDVADIDRDGKDDLFVTHLERETNTLYMGGGQGWFQDETRARGLAGPSLPFTAFGAILADLDQDGWLDLYVVNGAVKHIESLARQGDPFPLSQPNQLFQGVDGGSLEEAPLSWHSDRREVSRGLASGDLDQDGDVDLVVANNSGPARILRNESVGQGGWLGVRCEDAAGADVLHSRVTVEIPKAPPAISTIRTEGSFASAREPRAVIGLGSTTPARLRLDCRGRAPLRLENPPTERTLVFRPWP